MWGRGDVAPRSFVLVEQCLCEIGEPGVDDGVLADFVELNTHTDVEFAMDDAADGVELAVLVSDIDLEACAGGQRVEHVEIATFTADIASASREPGFGAGFDNLRCSDKGKTRRSSLYDVHVPSINSKEIGLCSDDDRRPFRL